MPQKRRNSKKWLWWGGGAFLVILLVIIGIIVWQNNNIERENNTELVSGTEEQQVVKSDEVEAINSVDSEEEKKVVQYEGDDPNTLDELTGTITYAGVNDGKLMIRVNIDQYVTEGTCELTLNRGGATIFSSIADLIGGVSTSTCEGFDVLVSELGGGSVQINIKLSTEGREGVIRGEVTI